MKTKTEYEKLEYDFWRLSSLKDDFEKGNLYYYSRDCFFKFETLLDVATAAGVKDAIYKRVETKVTLEDELSDISEGDVSFEFFGDEGLINLVFCGYTMTISFKTIHQLSEIIKRHEK